MGKVTNLTHPLFERYGKDLASMLAQVPVYKYWPVQAAGEGTRTLVSYADGAPALLERTFKGPKVGQGLALDHAAVAPAGSRRRARAPIPAPGTSFPCRT